MFNKNLIFRMTKIKKLIYFMVVVQMIAYGGGQSNSLIPGIAAFGLGVGIAPILAGYGLANVFGGNNNNAGLPLYGGFPPPPVRIGRPFIGNMKFISYIKFIDILCSLCSFFYFFLI